MLKLSPIVGYRPFEVRTITELFILPQDAGWYLLLTYYNSPWKTEGICGTQCTMEDTHYMALTAPPPLLIVYFFQTCIKFLADAFYHFYD